MKLTRLSTGYNLVDQKIEGGIPINTIVAYTGKSGQQKQEAGLKFIENGIINGEQTVIITTKYTPDQYRQLASEFNIDVDSTIFLDAVSWRMKRINPKFNSQSDYEVSNISDLNALLSTIMKICSDVNVTRILFDSPSSLLLYSTPGVEQVFKFFELLASQIRNNNITMIYALEEDVHDQSVVNTLLYLSDGHLKVSKKENSTKVFPQFLIFTPV